MSYRLHASILEKIFERRRATDVGHLTQLLDTWHQRRSSEARQSLEVYRRKAIGSVHVEVAVFKVLAELLAAFDVALHIDFTREARRCDCLRDDRRRVRRRRKLY